MNSHRDNSSFDMGKLYLDIWVQALKVFLGWSDDQTLKWAQEKWGCRLNEGDELFFHRSPEWYITPLLVPEYLRKNKIGDEWNQIESAVGEAIRDPDHRKTLEEYDSLDWNAARLRVRTILMKFGEDLPPLAN